MPVLLRLQSLQVLTRVAAIAALLVWHHLLSIRSLSAVGLLSISTVWGLLPIRWNQLLPVRSRRLLQRIVVVCWSAVTIRRRLLAVVAAAVMVRHGYSSSKTRALEDNSFSSSCSLIAHNSFRTCDSKPWCGEIHWIRVLQPGDATIYESIGAQAPTPLWRE
jgi:hypothetical protein